MRRLLWLLPLLPLCLWLLARPPSRFALEESARAFQEERSERYRLLSLALGEAEGRLLTGRHPEAAESVSRLRAERERSSGETRVWSSRGWVVTLIPAASAGRPPGEGGRAAALDPSGPRDPAALRGTMEIWIAPKGRLARLWDRFLR